MAALKVKLDNKQYPIEVDPSALTLGELEFLQEHFGLTDIREYNFLEPRQITGVVAVGVQRAHKDMPVDEVMEKARKLKYGLFIKAFEQQAEEEKSDPTSPAKAGKASDRAKTPAKPGNQPSGASTGSSPTE